MCSVFSLWDGGWVGVLEILASWVSRPPPPGEGGMFWGWVGRHQRRRKKNFAPFRFCGSRW